MVQRGGRRLASVAHMNAGRRARVSACGRARRPRRVARVVRVRVLSSGVGLLVMSGVLGGRLGTLRAVLMRAWRDRRAHAGELVQTTVRH